MKKREHNILEGYYDSGIYRSVHQPFMSGNRIFQSMRSGEKPMLDYDVNCQRWLSYGFSSGGGM